MVDTNNNSENGVNGNGRGGMKTMRRSIFVLAAAVVITIGFAFVGGLSTKAKTNDLGTSGQAKAGNKNEATSTSFLIDAFAYFDGGNGGYTHDGTFTPGQSNDVANGGRKISIYSVGWDPVPNAEGTTDSDGHFKVSVPGGVYFTCVTLPVGWMETEPASAGQQSESLTAVKNKSKDPDQAPVCWKVSFVGNDTATATPHFGGWANIVE